MLHAIFCDGPVSLHAAASSQKNNTGRPVEVFGKFSKNHLAEIKATGTENYE